MQVDFPQLHGLHRKRYGNNYSIPISQTEASLALAEQSRLLQNALRDVQEQREWASLRLRFNANPQVVNVALNAENGRQPEDGQVVPEPPGWFNLCMARSDCAICSFSRGCSSHCLCSHCTNSTVCCSADYGVSERVNVDVHFPMPVHGPRHYLRPRKEAGKNHEAVYLSFLKKYLPKS